MASIILPSRWTSQPQYPVEVDKNGIGQSILRAYLPRSATSVQDAANSYRFTTVDGLGREFASTTYGLATYYTLNQSDPGGWSAGTLVSTKKAYTLVSVSVWPATRGTANPYLFDSETGRLVVGFNSTDELSIFDGTWRSFGYSPFGKGAQSIVVTLFDNGKHKLFVNGYLVSSITAGTALNVGGTSRFYYRYADNVDQVYASQNHFISATYFFERALQEQEALSLSANPWQIFRPQRRILYFDVASGGSTPTLSAATATSVTATSAVPQVTLTFA